MTAQVTGTLVVDLTGHVDAFGSLPSTARMSVGAVLANAPIGAKVRDLEVCGANATIVARLVRALRRGGSGDGLRGAA